jgi:hypothetical protein
MTERRVNAEQQRRLEREGFSLEVTPAGKRLWREPETGDRLSGDHAFELVRQKEARTLEEAGWERAEEVGGRPTGADLRAATSIRKGPPTTSWWVPRIRGRKTRCEGV